jgi:hypothetical protein
VEIEMRADFNLYWRSLQSAADILSAEENMAFSLVPADKMSAAPGLAEVS